MQDSVELQKNQSIPLTVTGLSSDGNGVGHYNGLAIFVAGSVVGDSLQVRLAKVCKNYAYGIIEKIVTPSPDRTVPDCPVYRSCGGCDFRMMSYPAELRAKKEFVQNAMTRLGRLDVQVENILPSPQENGYRNKVQYPLTLSNGHITAGFYAARSHRVIPCEGCRLQPEQLNAIVTDVCALLEKHGVSVYDEATGKGLARHIYLRRGAHSGQIMVCLVCNGNRLPRQQQLVQELVLAHPEITTVVLNVNTRQTNVIMGEQNITLYGDGTVCDTLCNVPVRLNPLSFYQVNTPAAEQLYGVAQQFACRGEATDDTLLDLYCGAGTIGLSMAHLFKRVIGVEIIPQAIENARENAAAMGLSDKTRFICADAGTAATQLASEGLTPQVIVLDPPRKGCDDATLAAVVTMNPRRIVLVSCNPATAARDAAWLCQNGYAVLRVTPVDLFPRTKHVETVCLLSKLSGAKNTIDVKVDMDELDVTSAETKATYEEIKAYVLEQTGLQVSNLYIAQVKRECGIIERENYNNPKSEESRQPQCPEEKRKAIMEALKHFGMV